jgi:hypothetical protein
VDVKVGFQKLLASMRRASEASSLGVAKMELVDAIQRAERLSNAVTSAPVKRGRKGGSKTAERGSEYFRQIAAMRKTKAGGRPKKQVQKQEAPEPMPEIFCAS